MKPAKLNRTRTFLAGQRRLNKNSRFAIRDLTNRLGSSLLTAWFRRPALVAIIASLVLAVGLFVVRAADQTWGANGNSAWYTNGNWAGGAFPGLQERQLQIRTVLHGRVRPPVQHSASTWVPLA